MSKLLDRLHITHEAPTHEAPARIPESPEVVEHRRRTEEPPRRAASGIRWLRWIPVIALFAAGILAVTMLVTDEGTEVSDEPTASSYQLVQESIDEALAANRPTPASSYQLVQESIDAALLANQPSTLDIMVEDLEATTALAEVSSYQLVQESIDAALAANQAAVQVSPGSNPTTGPGSNSLGPTEVPQDFTAVAQSYDQVEANRTEVLRDLAPDYSYDRVEANRTDALRDMAYGPIADSYDRVEANRTEVLRDLATA